MDIQRDDYADNDLPPARKLSRIAIVLMILLAIVLIVVGIKLLAYVVAARMEWTV
jgi:hypothetical protein